MAVCSEADRDSPHLELADEVVMIGGPRSGESYLNMEAILAAAALVLSEAAFSRRPRASSTDMIPKEVWSNIEHRNPHRQR